VSKADGSFSIGAVHGGTGDLVLLVSKDGKRLFYRSIDHGVAIESLNITLMNGSQMMLDTPKHHDE
jgi:hypothetical protein